jgi:hypothetical protein
MRHRKALSSNRIMFGVRPQLRLKVIFHGASLISKKMKNQKMKIRKKTKKNKKSRRKRRKKILKIKHLALR